MVRKLTQEDYIAKVGQFHPKWIVIGTYAGVNKPIDVQCPNGHVIQIPRAGILSSGTQKEPTCTKCTHKKGYPISPTHFIQIMRELHPNLTMEADYEGHNMKMPVSCDICGYKREVWVSSLMNRHGDCPICRKEEHRLKSYEKFISKLKQINPFIEIDKDSYKNMNTTVKATCLRCGYDEWEPTPTGLIYKQNQCPRCTHNSTSLMEQAIYKSFVLIFGEDNVLSRTKTVINEYELDIYIKPLQVAIEPGSWTWHKEKIERDQKRLELCRAQNIKLITVFD